MTRPDPTGANALPPRRPSSHRGTDLRAGFTRALRTRPAPDVIVALTDGQTPWPGTRPPCRTVIGLFPRPYRSHAYDESDPEYVPDTPPAWARVVDIGS